MVRGLRVSLRFAVFRQCPTTIWLPFKWGAAVKIKQTLAKYLSFSGLSPLASHGITFLGGMCLAFDFIHLTLVPMKIASGHVLFSEESGRVLMDPSKVKVGELLHFQKVSEEKGSSRCRVADIWARVVQLEGGMILGTDRKNFRNYVEHSKGQNKDHLVWGSAQTQYGS
jgi:hypothetical protein